MRVGFAVSYAMIKLNNNRTVFLLLIILTIGFGTNCEQKISAELATQELEVYRLLLTDKPKELVVIDKSSIADTLGIDNYKSTKHIFKKLQKDTFDNFLNINKVSPNIEEGFRLSSENLVISSTKFESLKSKPDRYFRFSRVGFSNDGKQAIVWFNESCEPLCMKAGFYLLNYKNGSWEIVEESEKLRS